MLKILLYILRFSELSIHVTIKRDGGLKIYINARCPKCKEEIYLGVRIELEREKHKYTLTNIIICDTVIEENFVKSLLRSLSGQIYNGIEIDALEKMLQDKYGITTPCCKGLIEKIQLELNMYSPDMKSLHFV